MHHLGGFFAKPRPFLARRFRHDRSGHRTRPYGARPWRGRFPALPRAWSRARSSRSRATANIATTGPGSAARDRSINKAFNAAEGPICSRPARRGRTARRVGRFHPQLPAQLALEGQDHLPRYAAVVHRDGRAGRPAGAALRRRGRHPRRTGQWRDAARDRTRRDRTRPLGPRTVEEPYPLDGRRPPRLGDQPPARLGRADRALYQRRWPVSARRRGQRAHPCRVRKRRRRCLVHRRPCRPARPRLQPRRLDAGHRHPRRLVRFGQHARLRHRGALRQGRARRPLSRRQRPASRLVPVEPARKLRHARPRAIRRRPDARLCPRRQRPQDVEIDRQRRRSA